MGSIPVLCWQWGLLGLQFDSASRWSGPMEHKGEVLVYFGHITRCGFGLCVNVFFSLTPWVGTLQSSG